jgi:hypothetical protein
MSSYIVISSVSEALRQILWEAIDADPAVRPVVGSESAIVFKNPTETARDSSNRLSLWLYQVTENEYLKNQPMQRGNGNNQLHYPPLALNLYYLLTPFAASGEADHLLLGKNMQTMHDNAIVILHDPTSEVFEELHIAFCRLTLEELTRIWEALQEPYRLSVCYMVRVTRIDSLRTSNGVRVIDRIGRFGEMANEGQT